jgi:uncharacterized protein YoxC
MFPEIVVTILGIAFVLFAIFSIPPLLQLRKTAKAMAVTLQTLNENLPGILRNLESITANVNETTLTVNRQVEELSDLFRKLHRQVIFLSDMGRIVQAGARIPVLNTLTTLSALVKGVSVFLNVMNEKSDRPGSPPKK